MSNITAAVLFAVIEGFSPSSYAAKQNHLPGWWETVEERKERYSTISEDVVEVLKENGSIPGFTRAESAAMVLAVMAHESGFARDVDLGPCYRGNDPSKCDFGRAVCLMQVHTGEKTPEGWTFDDVQHDRRKCIKRGLSSIKMSWKTCSHLGEQYRLAGLSGSCDRGHKGAKEIWDLYRIASNKIVRVLKPQKTTKIAKNNT